MSILILFKRPLPADRIILSLIHISTTTGIGINQEPGDLTADKIGFTVSGKSEVAFDYKVQVKLTHADDTALTQDEWAKITPQITPSGETAVAGTPEMLTGEKSESCIYTCLLYTSRCV